MGLQRIELNENPGQEFSTVIDGNRVVFNFRYNAKSERFYFNVSQGETLVLQGRTLEANVDLFATLGPDATVFGKLFCVDIDNKDREPTLENIADGNVRVFLKTEE